MSHSDTPAIEVCSLCKVYAGKSSPPKEALKSVRSLISREHFRPLGPNGAGQVNSYKYSCRASDQNIRQRSDLWPDISRMPRRARGSIGLVPQELNLDSIFHRDEVDGPSSEGFTVCPRTKGEQTKYLALLGLRQRRMSMRDHFQAECVAAFR